MSSRERQITGWLRAATKCDLPTSRYTYFILLPISIAEHATRKHGVSPSLRSALYVSHSAAQTVHKAPAGLRLISLNAAIGLYLGLESASAARPRKCSCIVEVIFLR
jgi:hypothetical protein